MKKDMKKRILIAVSSVLFTSCSTIENILEPDSVWGMIACLIFGIAMLCFVGWMFIFGLSVVAGVIGVIVRIILTFFLPFND